MKEIKLKNSIALVDDEDFEWLNQWKWHKQKVHGNYYAVRRNPSDRKLISMSRLIMREDNPKILIDHKNRNTLDNQKHNLRRCTTSQNCSNKKSSYKSTSKYLGVCWIKSRNKWRAEIEKNGKSRFLGHFNSENDAALAYNKAAEIVHGEFANLNVI